MRAVALAILVVITGGCSARGWYEGLKASAVRQCQATPDSAEARRCEEQASRRNYDDYERERPK